MSTIKEITFGGQGAFLPSEGSMVGPSAVTLESGVVWAGLSATAPLDSDWACEACLTASSAHWAAAWWW